MTKVTYNMYSGDLCCMGREIMEIEGRDCANVKIVERRDIDVILEFD